MANILIACDSKYYDKWAVNCLKSIKKCSSDINLHVVIVNPDKNKELPGVNYYYEQIEFSNEDSKIAYYQAARFLKCAELFPNAELVMTIDCDSLCTEKFSQIELAELCTRISVLRHHKTSRWLAGLITFGTTSEFRNEFRNKLLELPISKWKPGYDQKVLGSLEEKYKFTESVPGDWIGFGYKKGKFITLKGEQKFAHKYISIYNKELKSIIYNDN
jgi:hypothetical protein